MEYKGKIKKLNKLVVSDPSYDSNVTSRYQKEKIDAKDLEVTILLCNDKTKLDNDTLYGIDINVLIKKKNTDYNIDNDALHTNNKEVNQKEYRICMDSACIAIGINDFAEEIKENSEWQPECALKTMTDGEFGFLIEGTSKDGKLEYIWFYGYLGADTEYSLKDVCDYLVEQLEIIELEPVIKEELNTKSEVEYDI